MFINDKFCSMKTSQCEKDIHIYEFGMSIVCMAKFNYYLWSIMKGFYATKLSVEMRFEIDIKEFNFVILQHVYFSKCASIRSGCIWLCCTEQARCKQESTHNTSQFYVCVAVMMRHFGMEIDQTNKRTNERTNVNVMHEKETLKHFMGKTRVINIVAYDEGATQYYCNQQRH